MIRAGLALSAVVLVLAGCSSTDSMLDSFTFMQGHEKPVRRDLFPADFKKQILATMPSVVANRSGIRDAYYSDPVMDAAAHTYASCVRFNARDATGQYAGSKEYVAYYYDGSLNQLIAAAGDECRTASYKPFPELERLCPGGKCS